MKMTDTNDTHYFTCATNNHSNSKNKKKITHYKDSNYRWQMFPRNMTEEKVVPLHLLTMLSNHYQLSLILKPIEMPVSSHFIQCICKGKEDFKTSVFSSLDTNWRILYSRFVLKICQYRFLLFGLLFSKVFIF